MTQSTLCKLQDCEPGNLYQIESNTYAPLMFASLEDLYNRPSKKIKELKNNSIVFVVNIDHRLSPMGGDNYYIAQIIYKAAIFYIGYSIDSYMDQQISFSKLT